MFTEGRRRELRYGLLNGLVKPFLSSLALLFAKRDG